MRTPPPFAPSAAPAIIGPSSRAAGRRAASSAAAKTTDRTMSRPHRAAMGSRPSRPGAASGSAVMRRTPFSNRSAARGVRARPVQRASAPTGARSASPAVSPSVTACSSIVARVSGSTIAAGAETASAAASPTRLRRALGDPAEALAERAPGVGQRLARRKPRADRLHDIALRELAVIERIVGTQPGEIDDIDARLFQDRAIGLGVRIDRPQTRRVAGQPSRDVERVIVLRHEQGDRRALVRGFDFGDLRAGTRRRRCPARRA